MPENEVKEVFFNSAAEAALETFSATGKIGVTMSALIEKDGELELMPIKMDPNLVDVRAATTKIDEAMEHTAAFVAKHPGSRVTVLFLTVKAQGTVLDRETKEESVSDVIINAARTEDGWSKTRVDEIKNGTPITLEEMDLGYEPEGAWVKVPAVFDMPGIAAFTILSQAWTSLATLRNMYQLGL